MVKTSDSVEKEGARDCTGSEGYYPVLIKVIKKI